MNVIIMFYPMKNEWKAEQKEKNNTTIVEIFDRERNFRAIKSFGTILELLQAHRKRFSFHHSVVVDIVKISYPIQSHEVCLSYSLYDANAWKCYVKYFRSVNTNAILQMDPFSNMLKQKTFSQPHTYTY